MKNFNPKRREKDVKVEEFQGEVLVYDLAQHTAHCLNSIAVSVWQYADGTLSVSEIAERIASDKDGQCDEDLVWRALEELDKASLLETPIPAETIDASRRRMVGQLGWAAAIPFVLSIAVPKPVFAQSVGPTAA